MGQGTVCVTIQQKQKASKKARKKRKEGEMGSPAFSLLLEHDATRQTLPRGSVRAGKASSAERAVGRVWG